MIEWTEEDRQAAKAEGWGLIGIPLRIGWDWPPWSGDIGPFRTNDETQAFVAKRADEGSELHVKAVAYVAQQRLLA